MVGRVRANVRGAVKGALVVDSRIAKTIWTNDRLLVIKNCFNTIVTSMPMYYDVTLQCILRRIDFF